MTNTTTSEPAPGSQKIWLSSLLLVAQFLTITPAVFLVLSTEQQRRVSESHVNLLDNLDRLASSITEPDRTAAGEEPDGRYRTELEHIRSDSAAAPFREALARVDSLLARNDVRAARSELSNAERAVRSELSQSTHRIREATSYLKAFVSGACLLTFGIVLVIRRFRKDAAIQRKLQQELRTTNQEVVAALGVARAEAAAKNQLLAHVGNWIKTSSNAAADATDATESLGRIADQIADYSKMESGTFKLQSVEFKPSQVVSEVLEPLGGLAERNGVRFTNDVGNGLSELVKGDPGRLREVLFNVIGSAIRIARKSEVVLSAGETMDAGRTTLRFEVRLTGKNFPEEFRHRIFEPFAQLPGESSGSEGTGLALAIAKKLAELMGGKIDVSSHPARGTTLWFTAVLESVTGGRDPQPQSRSSPALPALPAVGNDGSKMSGRPQPAKAARERRSEPRHGINYPTLLRSEQSGIASVHILDVSTSGLRVSAPFRLEVLTEVEIRIEGMSLVGTVRNCTQIRSNEFHVGIEIRPTGAGDEQYLHHLRLLRSE